MRRTIAKDEWNVGGRVGRTFNQPRRLPIAGQQGQGRLWDQACRQNLSPRTRAARDNETVTKG